MVKPDYGRALERVLVAQSQLITAVREEMLAVLDANEPTAVGRERVASRFEHLASTLEDAMTTVRQR